MSNITHLRRLASGLPDLADCVRTYLERCRLRGLAINSIKAYGADLARLIEFCARRGVVYPQQIGERIVQAWLDELARQGSRPRSLARRLAVARALFRYLLGEGLIDADPTGSLSVRFRPRRVVAPEMSLLLGMVRGIRAETPMDQRDRALLRLTLDTGLRVSEVCSLDLYDPARHPENTVDLVRLVVHVTGKGDEPATLPIEHATAREIEAWLLVRAQMAVPDCPALFVGVRGVRLTRAGVHLIVRRRGTTAGLTGLHTHLLRHRRIGQVVEIMGIEAGQYMARHRSKITTVAVYGAQAAEVLRRAVRQHCPLDPAAAS